MSVVHSSASDSLFSFLLAFSALVSFFRTPEYHLNTCLSMKDSSCVLWNMSVLDDFLTAFTFELLFPACVQPREAREGLGHCCPSGNIHLFFFPQESCLIALELAVWAHLSSLPRAGIVSVHFQFVNTSAKPTNSGAHFSVGTVFPQSLLMDTAF